MQLHRVILVVPFIRHYAGSVFELYENPTPDGWDDDERVREKISFNRRSYLLPDNGKGAPASLSESDTIICPPRLFEGVDLHTGPCRITATHILSELPAGSGFGADLSDIDGAPGQGILLRMGAEAKAPFQVQLTDMREGQSIDAYEMAQNPLSLDYSRLQPGFYRTTIDSRNGHSIAVHFIKCFPLVALLRSGSRDITGSMKTVY